MSLCYAFRMKIQREFIQKYKKIYIQIGAIKCPAINNELVHFNNKGLKHLLQKGRKKRKIGDQYRRLNLVKYISEIVSSQKAFVTKREVVNSSGKISYWELRKEINNRYISVIIRRKNNGRLHFYSVFSRK